MGYCLLSMFVYVTKLFPRLGQGFLVLGRALQTRGSGSHLLFSCHSPLITLITITTIILEHMPCTRNFNLNNNFDILKSPALVCEQGGRFRGKATWLWSHS